MPARSGGRARGSQRQRFIGGGLAAYVAGRLVVDVNIHFPFYVGAGVIVLGIGILATGHRLLGEAERVQAEAVRGTAGEPRMVTAGSNGASAELRRHAKGRVLVVDPDARVS